jgi:hypothetical protein
MFVEADHASSRQPGNRAPHASFFLVCFEKKKENYWKHHYNAEI